MGLGGIFLSAVTGNGNQNYLSDVHSEVLQICEVNSQAANSIVGTKISVTELDWCSYDGKSLSNIVKNVDTVIGADIFYDSSLFAPLSKLLSEMFEINSSLEIFLCVTLRNEKTWNMFVKSCQEHRLSVRHVTSCKELETHIFDYDRSIPINIVQILRTYILQSGCIPSLRKTHVTPPSDSCLIIAIQIISIKYQIVVIALKPKQGNQK